MKTSLFLAALAAFTTAGATENPLWMRYCSISPDGSTIAFCYKGDIYTVPSTGGNARQLTTNPAYDTHPIWSPDGQQIAFASSRQGSMDIYIVSKDGGISKRLTTHSGNETPVTFSDATHILFKANLMPDATDLSFPSAQFPQVYEINTQGGRPKLYSSLPMEDISVAQDGTTLLYHDQKGYEDPWRKHHTSSITRDICPLCLGTSTGSRHIGNNQRLVSRIGKLISHGCRSAPQHVAQVLSSHIKGYFRLSP